MAHAMLLHKGRVSGSPTRGAGGTSDVCVAPTGATEYGQLLHIRYHLSLNP